MKNDMNDWLKKPTFYLVKPDLHTPTLSADFWNAPSNRKQKTASMQWLLRFWKICELVTHFGPIFAWNFEDFESADKIGVCKSGFSYIVSYLNRLLQCFFTSFFRGDDGVVRKAYFRMAQKYHPDKNPEGRVCRTNYCSKVVPPFIQSSWLIRFKYFQTETVVFYCKMLKMLDSSYAIEKSKKCHINCCALIKIN